MTVVFEGRCEDMVLEEEEEESLVEDSSQQAMGVEAEEIDADSPNCSPICHFIYWPVCGSDGNTYPNECVFNYENCRWVHDLRRATRTCFHTQKNDMYRDSERQHIPNTKGPSRRLDKSNLCHRPPALNQILFESASLISMELFGRKAPLWLGCLLETHVDDRMNGN